VFSTADKSNKNLEARNRDLTPTVPIERLGGRLPSKSKIAFVDLKSIEGLLPGQKKDEVTGLDGASFFMPGYIPGNNATFRVGGMKGIAATVDYKQMIRDLYGVDHMYVPAINASEETKKLYNTKGIQAVRDKLTEEEFSKQMLDIMEYDALITDSVIKSPLFQNKSNKEAQDVWQELVSTPLGFGIGKTGSQFISRKSSLGRQM